MRVVEWLEETYAPSTRLQRMDADAWKQFDTEMKPFTENMDKVRQQLETLMLRRGRLPRFLRWL